MIIGSVGLSPRVRGTNVTSIAGTPGQGLSPRVRGNPDVAARHSLPLRSIPACAGEPG